jgi:pimeloyl-ACP methyl ester carboxylesterase
LTTSPRPQVLLLPGLLCDEWVWQAQREALANLADVTIADFSAHDDLVEMARASLALVEDVTTPIDVVGHSMGSRVALEIWRIAPRRVRSLVLLDTGVHGVQQGEAESRQVLLDLSATRGMSALAEAWLPLMVGADRRIDSTLMNDLRAMVMRATPLQHRGQINALLARPDTTSLLSTITVPTLVVVGRHDEWSPVSQHEEIVAAIAGARIEIIEDAGHMTTVERPDEISSLLRRWLQDR